MIDCTPEDRQRSWTASRPASPPTATRRRPQSRFLADQMELYTPTCVTSSANRMQNKSATSVRPRRPELHLVARKHQGARSLPMLRGSALPHVQHLLRLHEPDPRYPTGHGIRAPGFNIHPEFLLAGREVIETIPEEALFLRPAALSLLQANNKAMLGI